MKQRIAIVGLGLIGGHWLADSLMLAVKSSHGTITIVHMKLRKRTAYDVCPHWPRSPTQNLTCLCYAIRSRPCRKSWCVEATDRYGHHHAHRCRQCQSNGSGTG